MGKQRAGDETWSGIGANSADANRLQRVLRTLDIHSALWVDTPQVAVELGKAIRESRLRIPTLPATMSAVIELLNDPDSDLGNLAEAVSFDPGLAVKLVGVANSSYFAAAESVSDLQDAIMRIGTNETRKIIYVVALTAPLTQIDGFEEEAEHCCAHSRLAASVAEALLADSREKASMSFLAGLVHDIGRIVLLQFTRDGGTKPAYRKLSNTHELASLFDVMHARLGAVVLETWGFWPEIVDAVEYHHAPAEAPVDASVLAHALKSADLIAHRLTGSQPTAMGTFGDVRRPDWPADPTELQTEIDFVVAESGLDPELTARAQQQAVKDRELFAAVS